MADEQKPKSKAERLAEEWRAAGFEIEIGDHREGEHILIFYGAVPEGETEDEENA